MRFRSWRRKSQARISNRLDCYCSTIPACKKKRTKKWYTAKFVSKNWRRVAWTFHLPSVKRKTTAVFLGCKRKIKIAQTAILKAGEWEVDQAMHMNLHNINLIKEGIEFSNMVIQEVVCLHIVHTCNLMCIDIDMAALMGLNKGVKKESITKPLNDLLLNVF